MRPESLLNAPGEQGGESLARICTTRKHLDNHLIGQPIITFGSSIVVMDTGYFGAYVAFGEALGWMEEPPMSGNFTLMDVHGAGAQRSDPKSGDPANWHHGNGPQGDVIRIYNYVRLVRDIPAYSVEPQQGSFYKIELKPNYPNPANNSTRISFTSKEALAHPGVKIYNIIGQHVVTLTCEEDGAEEGFLYSVLWEGKDDSGMDAPSGVYLYNLIVNEQIAESKKLILMR